MRLQVIVSILNNEYDCHRATDYFLGRPKMSNGTMYVKWSRNREFSIDIDTIQLVDEKEIVVETNNGEKLHFKNVTCLNIVKEEKIVGKYVFSKQLIKRKLKNYNRKYNILRYYIYLMDSDRIVPLNRDTFFLLFDEIPFDTRQKLGLIDKEN